MTLRSFWTMLVSWRWILVCGLTLAVGAGAATFFVTPKNYAVTASYLLLSPMRGVDGKDGNPFLQLGNGVTTLADVLSVSLSDGETARSYTDSAPQLKYSVARDTSIGAPLILMKVEDVSAENAYKVLDSLTQELSVRLDTMQREAGAPKDLWVTMSPLTRDTKPLTNYGMPVRNGILVLVGCLLATLLLIGILERRRIGRRAVGSGELPSVAVSPAKRPARRSRHKRRGHGQDDQDDALPIIERKPAVMENADDDAEPIGSNLSDAARTAVLR